MINVGNGHLYAWQTGVKQSCFVVIFASCTNLTQTRALFRTGPLRIFHLCCWNLRGTSLELKDREINNGFCSASQVWRDLRICCLRSLAPQSAEFSPTRSAIQYQVLASSGSCPNCCTLPYEQCTVRVSCTCVFKNIHKNLHGRQTSKTLPEPPSVIRSSQKQSE